ncbi:ATP-binding protein [Tabrizicola sp.]|uniref:GAF domain-containing sensor histidine kinase n=1 Tax=Tabrizicola sp. TaxID=2005166 RepID=UPI003F3FEFD2
MRLAMDASLVFVTVGVGKPPVKARSISSWSDDGDEKSFEYDLEGTPCLLVYGGETMTVSEGLYRRFPVEVGYEGYVGVPIRRVDGKVMGHLAVLSRHPIKAPEEALSVIQIFAMRAEAEFQRLELQQEMEAMVASLSLATRRLTNRQNALRQSNLAKTALLGMMAHDLRNPLSAILSRSEIIEGLLEKHNSNADLTQKVRKNCESIASMVERMDRQIASCLVQARDDATKLKIDVHEFPLARACDLAVALNATAAAAKSIALEYSPPTEMMLKGDEDKLVEAVDNLISNAIKYSNAGKSIFVEARKRAGCTEISVRDEGLGLTPDDQSRAFGKFQRLSAKPTAGESSTGLGLAIVKAIIDAHGGTIRIQSEGESMGATFTIVLPDP